MITMTLAHGDLARVRFAYSPVRDLIASLRALQNPQRQPIYSKWRTTVTPQLAGVNLRLLLALSPVGRYAFDFLMPIPTETWAELTDELAVVMKTPAADIRAELDYFARGRRLPNLLRPLYDDPGEYMPYVADEMLKYWEVAIEPLSARVRAVVTADLFHRMQHFASGGVAHVLGQLHPDVTFTDRELLIHKPNPCVNRYELAGGGVLLIPSVFSWPSLMVQCDGAGQASLSYAPRGVVELWNESSSHLHDPLSALVGRARASLLALLALPATTTELAYKLDISPPAVSQHLKVLKAAGLASSRRSGRTVLYQRTASACALLNAIPGNDKRYPGTEQ